MQTVSRSIEEEQIAARRDHEVAELTPGDTVRVHNRIVEGRNERVQIFQGTIIRLSGRGVNRSVTVRRIAAHGVGVERTFMVYSPRVEKIEVMRHARVRRAKLYFLRNLTGKRARLVEKRY